MPSAPTPNLVEYVGGRIRELRAGMSQEALAAKVEVATNTVSRWETGIYRPSIEDLDRLARFFKVSILTFFPPDPTAGDDQFVRLRKAASGLKAEDVEELERYAEFRKARYRLGQAKRPGRKPKSP